MVVFVTQAPHRFCLHSDLPFKMSYSLLSLKLAFIHGELPFSMTPVFYSDNSVRIRPLLPSFLIQWASLFFNSSHFLMCPITAITTPERIIWLTHLFLSTQTNVHHGPSSGDILSLRFPFLLFSPRHWSRAFVIKSSGFIMSKLICPHAWVSLSHLCSWQDSCLIRVWHLLCLLLASTIPYLM